MVDMNCEQPDLVYEKSQVTRDSVHSSNANHLVPRPALLHLQYHVAVCYAQNKKTLP